MRRGDGAASAGHGGRRGRDAQSWGEDIPERTGVETTNTDRSGREKREILCGKEKATGNKTNSESRVESLVCAMIVQRRAVGAHS